ncbi:Phage head completion-stabilization protein [Pseudomonas chlororaphis subsp. aurantiaca]|uniref:head completion/stabilization protein n=1 Tax=Pseudomonas chlororaphis TaxID=587753 RepID=UPI000F564EAF|nr:head completion/stabilization protein [Pseudomonas chlororaphis]AZD34670.1 Phage head completion-stabilization protein [Pseudomonas chlororaphis subsp. aurantiaca]AZD41005.1 Phage head completion-stabilization protein [Pseudomonas chlororaphis subsp. aurantiaca]
MSGFVAGGPPPGGQTSPDGHINTSPFWPSIDLDALRGTLRLDNSITAPRLETAVIAAAISVNRELAAWRIEKQAAGYSKLEDVPGETVEDVSEQIHLYRRAIEAATGAEVCERYRSYDTTNSGGKKADDIEPNIDDYRRDLRWAIRDFLGIKRTTVELI